MLLLSRAIFTARRSYAGAVLGVVIFVRPSVCHTRALWQNQTMICEYFDITRKAITLVFWHQQWLMGDAPLRMKFVLKVTHLPFEKRRIRQISACNVSAVRDSETKFNCDK